MKKKVNTRQSTTIGNEGRTRAIDPLWMASRQEKAESSNIRVGCYTQRGLGFSRNYGIHQATCQRRHSRRRTFSLARRRLERWASAAPMRRRDRRVHFFKKKKPVVKRTLIANSWSSTVPAKPRLSSSQLAAIKTRRTSRQSQLNRRKKKTEERSNPS